MKVIPRLFLMGGALLGGWFSAPLWISTGKSSRESRSQVGKASVPVVVATGGNAGTVRKQGGTVARMLVAAGMVPGNGVGDYPQRLEELRKLDAEGSVMMSAYDSLLREWIASDPEAAFRYAFTTDGGRHRGAILERWIEHDTAAALAAVEALEDGAVRKELLGVCATALVASDLDRALKLIEKEGLMASLSEDFFVRVASKDPRMALALLPESMDSSERKFASMAIYKEWARSDPETAARELVMDVSLKEEVRWSSSVVTDSWKQIAGEWFRKDSAAAAAFFADADHPERRASHIGEIVGVWGSWDAEGALDFAKGLEGETRKKAMDGLVNAKLAGDASAAMELALASDDDDVIERVVYRWATKDWEASLAAVLAMPPGERRDLAVGSFTQGLRENVVTGSTGIGEWVGPMMELAGKGKVRDLDLSWAYEALSRDEIVRYAGQFGEPFLVALGESVRSSSYSDPVGAAALVDALPDGNSRQEMMQIVAANWARQDAESAMRWAGKLPEGPDRNTAYRNVVNAALRLDAAQARELIDALPASSARDVAVVEFISERAGAEGGPEILELARTVSGDAQNDAIRAALQGWIARDPDAAQRAMAGMELPDSVREQAAQFAASEAWWRAQGKEPE